MHALVNGARMFYLRQGSGHPVVMIHDRASTHEVWQVPAAAVAEHNLVVVFDSRGVGRSELGPAGVEYTTELLADDVIGLLDELGLDRATLVGISMGGGVAQMTALRHPERVASLVLVSTSPEMSPAVRARMRAEADRIEVDGIGPDMVEVMTARWFSPEFAATHPEVIEHVRSGILQLSPAVLAARSRANAERDFTDRLAEIRCPVLYMAGAADPTGPTTHAARFGAALPQLETHLIAGASHLVPIEAADEVSRVLIDFVARHHHVAAVEAD